MPAKKHAKRHKSQAARAPALSLADLLHVLPVDAARSIWHSLPRCSKKAFRGTCRDLRSFAQQDLTTRLVVEVVRQYLDLLGRQGTTIAQRFVQLRELELRLPLDGRGASNRLDRHIQSDFLDALGTCTTVQVLKLCRDPILSSPFYSNSTLTHWQLSRSFMASIAAAFPCLQQLQLEVYKRLDGPIFDALAPMSSLTQLELTGEPWTMSLACLQSIARLSGLCSLTCRTHAIDETAGSASFSDLTALTTLVWDNATCPAGLELSLIQSAPALQNLELTSGLYNVTSEALLASLCQMTDLRRLVLDIRIHCPGMNMLEQLPGVTELDGTHLLGYNSIKTANLARIPSMQPHESLRVLGAHGELTDIAAVVQKFPNLQVLRITTDVDVEPYSGGEEAHAIAAIAAHPALTRVELDLTVYPLQLNSHAAVTALKRIKPLAGLVTHLALEILQKGQDMSATISYLARHYPRLEVFKFDKWPSYFFLGMSKLSNIRSLKQVTFSGLSYDVDLRHRAAAVRELRWQAEDIAEAVEELAEAGIDVMFERVEWDFADMMKEHIVGTPWGDRVSCKWTVLHEVNVW